jgi:hypothetical protein
MCLEESAGSELPAKIDISRRLNSKPTERKINRGKLYSSNVV